MKAQAILSIVLFVSCTQMDYTSLVDTTIGVVDDRSSNCVIGPMLPYGSINPSPQTFDGSMDGYQPGQPIDGFAQLHVSGTGWSSYGHFLVQPQTGELSTAVGTHSSEHSDDVALPYLYATNLDRYGVRVEVAPSHYSAIYRFTYPRSDSSSILFDASQSIARDIASFMGGRLLGNEVRVNPGEGEVRMMIRIEAGWPEGPYDLYMYGRVDKKMESYGVWEEGRHMENETELCCDTLSTTHKGAWCSFSTVEGEQVLLKLAISFTGYDRARQLLESEIPGWDFDKVAAAGKREWNAKLSVVDADFLSEEDAVVFYSALYRVFTFARDRSLDNGKWESEHPFWDDNYAYWDTFRTLFPLLVILDEDAVRGNILSMIDRFEHNGGVYDGFIAGRERTLEQGGNDVDCIISDAYVKGVKGIDWEKAYAIVKHNADKRRNTIGYIPTCNMSSSQTLEYAYNDYCAGLMADGLGHGEDARRYMERSHKWTAIWNPDLSDGIYSGFVDAVDEKGVYSFIAPDKYGGSWVSPFYEGSAWTYNYFVPHDFEKLIALMGGNEAFAQRLDYGMRQGLVKYDNEPGFLATRAFVHAGRPDLSSFWVHHSMHNGFDLQGYPGNEDTGAMASWYIFCNLGLCPNAGQDFYYLNAPMLKSAVLNLQGGNKLRIVANAAPENVYVQSVKVNGRDWNSAILPHSEIACGGTLEFVLSPVPTTWAMPEGR
ncbi:MAG: GH92 family glycosyl hydrolase [Bacteroidales bacterium]|nr:GH92 family glycosyl hydrolase [Candidatus Hennigimonas equi]